MERRLAAILAADMLISTDELNWRAELGHANRAFAATIGAQRYENISCDEARRLRQPQPDHKAIPIAKMLAPGDSQHGQRKAPV